MIDVGDRVMVVRLPSCGCDYALGNIFDVAGIRSSNTPPVCLTCHQERADGNPAAFGDTHMPVEVYRLRKLPPLTELEGQKTEEVTREPANHE
jgi:hypothetical protein